MAQQLVTDIILNLGGNLAAKARQYGTSMGQFARQNQRAMGIVRASTSAAGRGLDALGNRYTAAIAGVASGAQLRATATLDRRLSRLAIAAEISREEAAKLFDQIQSISNQEGIRVDPSETLAGVEEILTKIGDLDYAMRNLPNIATVIQATGASGTAVGGIFTEFKKLAIDSQEEAMKAIDILNIQGKSGAFTLGNMASLGPRIFAAYAATGRQGVNAVTELGAALQVIRQGVGSDDQAVTAFEAFIRDITNPDRVKKLKEVGGIDVFDPEQLKKGVEVMRPLPELLEEITVKSKGMSGNLAMLNLTDEAKRALNPLIAEFTQTGSVSAFDKFMAVTGDGSVTMNDAAVAAGDFAASLQLIGNAWSQFANRELAEPVAKLAEAINSLDPEAVQRWLETGKNIALVVGTLVAAKKAKDLYGSAKDLFGSGKPGAGGKGGFADLGAMPVYVVNMPGGGLAGPGGIDMPDQSGKNTRKGRLTFNKVLQGAVLYPIVDAAADAAIGDTTFGKWAKETTLGDVAGGLKGFFSPNVPAAGNPFTGNLDITVTDDRVKVSRVTSNYPGLNIGVDTGRSMTSY